MNNEPHMLWLSVSQFLKCLDQRLLSQLAKIAPVRRWEYIHTADEPCCIESIISALHEHIDGRASLERRSGQANAKIHLLGHGVSGVIALLYARRYPEHIASLTLLSVGEAPAINWQAHYYARRLQLPCSREIILAHMVQLLMGPQSLRLTKAVSGLLAQDLDSNLTLHSLAHRIHIRPGGVSVPLLICNGENDPVVGHNQQPWRQWLKAEDNLWLCPEGKHFFHFHHAEKTAEAIGQHIQQSARLTAEQSTSVMPTAAAVSEKEPGAAYQYEGLSRLLKPKSMMRSDWRAE